MSADSVVSTEAIVAKLGDRADKFEEALVGSMDQPGLIHVVRDISKNIERALLQLVAQGVEMAKLSERTAALEATEVKRKEQSDAQAKAQEEVESKRHNTNTFLLTAVLGSIGALVSLLGFFAVYVLPHIK